MEIVQYNEMKKTWQEIAHNNNGNIPPNFELEVYKKNAWHIPPRQFLLLHF